MPIKMFYVKDEQDMDVLCTSLCAYLDNCAENGFSISEDLRMQIAARWLRILGFEGDPNWQFYPNVKEKENEE